MPLQGLGLSAAEADAYRLLVARPSGSVDDVAAVSGGDPAEARRVLAALENKGLVARSGTATDRYVASPPTVALGSLLVTRQQELRRAEQELGSLAEAYRGASSARTVGDVVDVVMGPHAVAQRFSQLQTGAEREVLAFVKAGVLVVSSDDNVEEARAARRGVHYRVLVERAVVERPGFLVDAEESLAIGEEIRVATSLPSRLLVVDRSLAMLPMLPIGLDAEVGALLVHASPLLDLLVEVFEASWRHAVPMTPATPGSDADLARDGLTSLDLRVLGLLDAGLTDRAVATQLGLSMRTVQRRVRLLMDVAGVDTRFQLGVEAVRRGWTATR